MTVSPLGVSSIFPQLYVPPALYSHSSIFPQLCSPSSMFSQLYVPQLYIPPALCSPSSMSPSSIFPQLYVLLAIELEEYRNAPCHWKRARLTWRICLAVIKLSRNYSDYNCSINNVKTVKFRGNAVERQKKLSFVFITVPKNITCRKLCRNILSYDLKKDSPVKS